MHRYLFSLDEIIKYLGRPQGWKYVELGPIMSLPQWEAKNLISSTRGWRNLNLIITLYWVDLSTSPFFSSLRFTPLSKLQHDLKSRIAVNQSLSAKGRQTEQKKKRRKEREEGKLPNHQQRIRRGFASLLAYEAQSFGCVVSISFTYKVHLKHTSLGKALFPRVSSTIDLINR